MAYVDLTTRFVYNLQTVFGDFSKLANNDKFIKENGWQDGTVGVFFQAASPTGWTKITTADARALRITSGSGGGVGGSTDPASTITLAHTNSISSDGTHTHSLASHTHSLANSGGTKANHGQRQPLGPDSSNRLRPINTGIHTAGFTSKINSLPLVGSITTGSGGAHDHGGATDSKLSNIALAYVNVIFASKDTSSGYTDLSSTFVHNSRHVYDYMQTLTYNDAFNYARRTPAGTVSLFGTATAPVGWTKLTTADASLLRVVSGTGAGSGGSKDPGTVISLAHTHADLTSGGSHSHSVPNHNHTLSDGTLYSANQDIAYYTSASPIRENAVTSPTITINPATPDVNDGSGTSSTDGAHQHTVASALSDTTLAYFNSIQASKDSAGAPTSYTDVTALFATYFSDQFLLAYQEMQLMANNDAYLYYHVMPSAAVCFFFQASAPLNWTKSVAQNDCVIRIVSGASGGTGGGSASISAGLTLAHTHVLNTKSHSHTYGHTHVLATAALVSTNASSGNINIFGPSGAEIYRDATPGGTFDDSLGSTTDTQTPATDTVSHNHGGLTGSALSNVTLAYADVIMCSKN